VQAVLNTCVEIKILQRVASSSAPSTRCLRGLNSTQLSTQSIPEVVIVQIVEKCAVDRRVHEGFSVLS